jgi:hypothetical protein
MKVKQMRALLNKAVGINAAIDEMDLELDSVFDDTCALWIQVSTVYILCEDSFIKPTMNIIKLED